MGDPFLHHIHLLAFNKRGFSRNKNNLEMSYVKIQFDDSIQVFLDNHKINNYYL
jgi:hypothetical protein